MIDPLGEFAFDPSLGSMDPAEFAAMDDIYAGMVDGFRYGWSRGYYQCFAKCMIYGGGASAPILTKGAESAAEPLFEKMGTAAGRKYYTWKYPKWFKAGGKHSKVLAPGFGMTVAKAVSVVGWGFLIYEEYECMKKCMKCL